MSDLRGISEKCADALKMYEPLVVLDDVVVTVDKEKERLYIVSKEDGACIDQVGTPTYAGDLASVIYQVIEENQLYKEGIYHFSNELH